MVTIKTRLIDLKKSIHHAELLYGRTSDSVTLLAVSKTWPSDILRQAFQAGQRYFGENYLQEALVKIQDLVDLNIEWHFIGPIQSNKTKDIAQHFSWVQSIDRLKIAQRLAAQRPSTLPNLNVCIQVNIDDEPSKSGVTITELFDLALHVSKLDRLTLRGLMIIPAQTNHTEQQRASFKRARALFEKLRAIYPSVDTLSMGMSGDRVSAIAEGSTMIRIGTGLFGQRATP